MTTSNFLKMARARDDQNLIWRVAAALAVKAQYQAEYTLSAESRAMTDWVLDHPMESIPLMVAFVSTNGTIVSNITITNNTIDTSAVPDSDIEYVVGDRWDTVARLKFKSGSIL